MPINAAPQVAPMYQQAYQQPFPQQMMAPQPQNQFMPQPQMPMNVASQPGLSIVSVNSDDQITNYPVASGNTVLFVNFNTNRMCFKSTNVNGVPMALRWAAFTYDEQNGAQNFQPTNQNESKSVSREEFNELKDILAQTLALTQTVVSSRNQDDQPRYNQNGKRGMRNDGSKNPSANDG